MLLDYMKLCARLYNRLCDLGIKSINNIMYTLKKSNNIILEDDTCVSANALILLTGGKNSSFAVFLNDYNSAVYVFEASSLITLIGI